jgi:hypothetical protein
MGKRERKRRVRGEEAEALVRAQLEPLAPGETPGAVKVAAVVAALMAAANLVSFLAGLDLGDQQPGLGGVVFLSALLLIAAVFMWRAAYWAILGFQALLALVCVGTALALVAAIGYGNLLAIAACVVVLGASGALFWFLVRAMARIQMPTRPTRESR